VRLHPYSDICYLKRAVTEIAVERKCDLRKWLEALTWCDVMITSLDKTLEPERRKYCNRVWTREHDCVETGCMGRWGCMRGEDVLSMFEQGSMTGECVLSSQEEEVLTTHLEEGWQVDELCIRFLFAPRCRKSDLGRQILPHLRQ